jgi:uncharacterized protein YndB with AHSA1/START domain
MALSASVGAWRKDLRQPRRIEPAVLLSRLISRHTNREDPACERSSDMATVRVSKDIAAPVESVFEMFTDIDHAADKVRGIEEVSVLSASPVFSLGTRWRETRKVLGTLDTAEMEVTAFERNRAYTITHHKAGVRIDATFTFDPVPSGTRVSVEFAMSNQGLPPGLLSPLEWAISSKVRDVLESDLSDLKGSLEQIVNSLDPRKTPGAAVTAPARGRTN